MAFLDLSRRSIWIRRDVPKVLPARIRVGDRLEIQPIGDRLKIQAIKSEPASGAMTIVLTILVLAGLVRTASTRRA